MSVLQGYVLIPLFHYRSDTDTFEAGNGRYRYFAPQAFSQETASDLNNS